MPNRVAMKFRSRLLRSLTFCCGLAIVALAATASHAEDFYFNVTLNDVKIVSGNKPVPPVRPATPGESSRRLPYWPGETEPYAVLDVDGEVYLGRSFAYPEHAGGENFGDANRQHPRSMAIRTSHKGEVTGRLFFPTKDGTRFESLKFEVPPAKNSPAARKSFHELKAAYYRNLENRGSAGTAWFRYQHLLAEAEGSGKPLADLLRARREAGRRGGSGSFDQTYDLFSGGRAISENLQLDRLLIVRGEEGEPIADLNTILGITVAELDWSKYLKDAKPALDPLARSIPHDQHAVFFPSFARMIQLFDMVKQTASMMPNPSSTRQEDARVAQRYEQQLCLPASELARAVGPHVVRTVAITGGDPYLPTGTDVAVLFDASLPTVLKQFITVRQKSSAKKTPGCQQVRGNIGEVSYTGVITPDRRICSYVASVGDLVVVTNSLRQLERILTTAQPAAKGKPAPPSLASLPEYQFFRTRYPRTRAEEAAFLFLSDATIRRWCGPKMRIANSRRERAAAVLNHYQAANLSTLARQQSKSDLIRSPFYVPDLGTLRITPHGVASSTYGTLGFLTPLSEIDFDKVSQGERDAYIFWRDGYQRNWSNFFDPIGLSISLQPDRVGADLTVMPLISSSEYNRWVGVSKGASFQPEAGDRHPGTLLHWIFAINMKSEAVRGSRGWLEQTLKVDPFSWVGSSIEVYFDDDAFWKELATSRSRSFDRFVENQLHRLPVVLRVDVKDSFKLALTLTALRAFIQQAAPNLLKWENLTHRTTTYVKISAAQDAPAGNFPKNLALYYVATPKSLVFTFHEAMLHRAIDRETERSKPLADRKPPTDAKPAPPVVLAPWLGSNLGVQLDLEKLQPVLEFLGHEMLDQTQRLSWSNLPILNEWRRRFPKLDPVEVHERVWTTRLVCPGGGKYVWNEEFQTMESTVFGHPGQPKNTAKLPGIFQAYSHGNFGLTFEPDGLRVRTELQYRVPSVSQPAKPKPATEKKNPLKLPFRKRTTTP